MDFNYFILIACICYIVKVESGEFSETDSVAKTYYNEIQPMIVGGELALPGQYPHQVALLRRSRFSCGGSIISRQHVLTAAHCVLENDEP